MNNIVKKIAILSIIGLMGLGLGTSVLEASPPMQQLDDQEQVRHEAERIENERHEQVMERRLNESEQEWNERQRRENERHEKKLWLIAHAILNININ